MIRRCIIWICKKLGKRSYPSATEIINNNSVGNRIFYLRRDAANAKLPSIVLSPRKIGIAVKVDETTIAADKSIFSIKASDLYQKDEREEIKYKFKGERHLPQSVLAQETPSPLFENNREKKTLSLEVSPPSSP